MKIIKMQERTCLNLINLLLILINSVESNTVIPRDNLDDIDTPRDSLSHHLSRHPRDVNRKMSKLTSATLPRNAGKAVYFHGNGAPLKLRLLKKTGPIVLPSKVFSVEFWAQPEGGQMGYTSIIQLYDECSHNNTGSGWSVGIMTSGQHARDARFVFSLKTEAAASTSHRLAHKQYEANVWTHVAATYNGDIMSLYIDGAKMSLSREQNGAVFEKTSAKCKLLLVGGSGDGNMLYRGKLDEFRLWNKTLSHKEIVENMRSFPSNFVADEFTILSESFNNLDQWRFKTSSAPEITMASIPTSNHNIRLESPPCGRTVCDDPEAVTSYLRNHDLRNTKTVRYRIVNIMNGDGSNPMLAEKQIVEQHDAIKRTFEIYNISFELFRHNATSTFLRQRVIMFRCVPYMVGNGECDVDCGHSTTGNDGGDCDDVHTECHDELLGNKVCDAECNKVYHNYDDGDCCLPDDDNVHKTCIDPVNPRRGYINIDDVKVELALEGTKYINIFFITASWFQDQFRGIATFPWEKNVYTSVGGNIIHANTFGHPLKTEALIHELGHNLGLWHVHRGVSEVDCNDACAETHPSMVLGDLCSDTNPTPKNRACRDPVPGLSSDTCGVYKFENTPFNNYMSYANDACTDHFTPQQVARMHCYLDLVYQPMREMKTPSPVPITPKVVETDTTSVKIVWLEPLGTDASCDSDDAFYQYAETATSSHNGVRWSPSEATGFPDADQCTASRLSWMPHYVDTPPTCRDNTCWLQLGFKVAVVPQRFNLWISDIHDASTDIDVEMISTNGMVEHVGTVPVYCDMATTILVNTQTRIKQVRIYTSDSYVAIDAIEMVSKANFHVCTKTKSPKYKLTREPSFAKGYEVLAETEFTDRTVEPGSTYTYSVHVVMDSRSSVPSPSLVYEHGQSYCGDGILDTTEDCDDKNVFDGDGCSITCKLEDNFRCSGSPSLCYIYENDGICEDFEKETNLRDCGIFTPEGYVDHWATSAVANPDYQRTECPESAVTGIPDDLQKCELHPAGSYWRPCGEALGMMGHFWLEVFIYKPVVAVSILLHLASDGKSQFSSEVNHIHIDLIEEDNNMVPIHPIAVEINCEDSPIEIPIVHDLRKPFLVIKGVRISFTTSSIGISAVRIRSSPFVNPPVIASCAADELYNPRSGYCVEQSCKKVTCHEFPLKNGVADCSGLDEGDSCTVLCNDGYSVEGHTNEAVCVNGDWVSQSPLDCLPIDCDRPKIQHATVACPTGTTFVEDCHFKCNKPAVLIGTDTTISCQSDKKWSSPKSTCLIQCEPLGRDRYINGILRTQSCIDGPQKIGQQCKVRCNEGYHVQGERNKKRFMRVLCADYGGWQGEECVPNLCPSLPTMFKGAYICTDGFYSGSICTMGCPGDLSVFKTVTCTADGEWNGELTLCPSDVQKQCDDIPATETIEYACADTKVGGKCSVKCKEPNHVPLFKISQDGSTEVITKMFDKVECMVVNKWEPNPSRIHCVKRCAEWSIGDGICEAENNRAVCDWDGGDCCESTVDDGFIITIPEDCPLDCKCRDPSAPENRRRKRRHKSLYNDHVYRTIGE